MREGGADKIDVVRENNHVYFKKMTCTLKK
jgi:hypothetical protein